MVAHQPAQVDTRDAAVERAADRTAEALADARTQLTELAEQQQSLHSRDALDRLREELASKAAVEEMEAALEQQVRPPGTWATAPTRCSFAECQATIEP